LFPLRFGNDSFKPHHAAAQATGKPCIVLNLPGIAVDVDNPADLQQLISLPGETRAQRLARQYAVTVAAKIHVGTGDSPVQPRSGAE
jgi:2-phospho-L-lactate guanylyltransferase